MMPSKYMVTIEYQDEGPLWAADFDCFEVALNHIKKLQKQPLGQCAVYRIIGPNGASTVGQDGTISYNGESYSPHGLESSKSYGGGSYGPGSYSEIGFEDAMAALDNLEEMMANYKHSDAANVENQLSEIKRTIAEIEKSLKSHKSGYNAESVEPVEPVELKHRIIEL